MRKTASGFTLLELLLTLFIIGVMAILAVISVQDNPHKVLDREARRLALLLETAGEEAVVQGLELALSFSGDSYEFLRFDPEEKSWVQLEAKPFNIYTLPNKVKVYYSRDGEQLDPEKVASMERFKTINGSDNAVPMLLLLSSGETSAYRIELQHDTVEEVIRIQGDGFGGITVYD